MITNILPNKSRNPRSLQKIILTFRGLAEGIVRSSHPERFLVKGVLKICNKSTGEHPCRLKLHFGMGAVL